MKKLVITGLLGAAAISAYFVFSGDKHVPAELIAPKAKIVSPADFKASLSDTRPVRNVEKSEAEAALDKLGLWESSDQIGWAERSGDNGNYVFTNFDVENDGDIITVSELEISGVRLVEDIAYFDNFTASGIAVGSEDDKSTTTIDTVQINMPDVDIMRPWLTSAKSSDLNSPLDFVENLINSDRPIPALPEIVAENITVSSLKEVRDSDPQEGQGPLIQKRPLRKTKEVEEVTRFGFVGLSRMEGTDLYRLQMNNLNQDGYSYFGRPESQQLTALNISGFKADVLEDMKSGQGDRVLFGAMSHFKPAFQSASLQGLSLRYDTVNLAIDQAGMWYSDTQGNRFTESIEVPSVRLSSNQTGQNKGVWSDNPLSEIGYETAQMSFGSRANYDKANRSVDLEEARFSLVDGFEGKLAYRLSNWEGLDAMGRRQFENIEGGLQQKPTAPTIEFGQMKFTDQGLLDRVHEKVAEERGIDVSAAKEASKGAFFLSTVAGQTEYQQELIKSAAESYAALVDTGGSFEVLIQPFRAIELNELEESMQQLQRGVRTNGKNAEDQDTGELERLKQQADALLREMNISFTHFP